MRDPLVIGNWKLNGNLKMVTDLVSTLCSSLNEFKGCHVAIAPPNLYLDLAKKKY
jgi:triosephosphate isomerase